MLSSSSRSTSSISTPKSPVTDSTTGSVRTPSSGESSYASFDIDQLSPDTFFSSSSNDMWWPKALDEESASSTTLGSSSGSAIRSSSVSGMSLETSLSVAEKNGGRRLSVSATPGSASSCAAVSARRRLDRETSASSLSSSMSSSAYFSDSTISTAVSSITIDEEPSIPSGNKSTETEISEMIHRLITGDDSGSEVRPGFIVAEDDDDALFASVVPTTEHKNTPNMDTRPIRKKPDPLHALFAISSPTSKSASRNGSENSSVIDRTSVSRGTSVPASITIPAEKDVFDDESESDFALSRELSTISKSHDIYSARSTDISSVSYHGHHGQIGEDIFADDDDEIISMTSHEETSSMDVDKDILFGGLDDFGLIEEEDPFTFLGVVGDEITNEVVESTVAW
ncbi:hypothetical protein V1511DRAFT_303908 [Dipodascopsis uninucleata]